MCYRMLFIVLMHIALCYTMIYAKRLENRSTFIRGSATQRQYVVSMRPNEGKYRQLEPAVIKASRRVWDGRRGITGKGCVLKGDANQEEGGEREGLQAEGLEK